MTREDFILLCTPGMRLAVAENISGDPLKIALDSKIPHPRIVASQVKYLQRARKKLPSYYAAQCVIPSRAFEQSSSERCAEMKEFSGRLCIDLTCGLGVDSFALSRRFDKVIAIEKDPLLADIARYNFTLLGADNIEVVCAGAEEFIAEAGKKADLVYADPDRRGEKGNKLYLLEDCSPDMVSLMPHLKDIAGKIVIKCSPLFDIDRPAAIFGPHTLSTAVSMSGECKEVLIETGEHIPYPMVRAAVAGEWTFTYDMESRGHTPRIMPERPEYLIVPDVALQKTRIAALYFTQVGAWIGSNNSYALTNILPEVIPGRVYRIINMEDFDPSALKKVLKGRGIKSIEIMHREFPASTADLARQLGVREGGKHRFAFFGASGKHFYAELE